MIASARSAPLRDPKNISAGPSIQRPSVLKRPAKLFIVEDVISHEYP
jgi:hypothetical protein